MTLSPWSAEYRKLSLGIVSLVSVFAFEGIAVGAIMPVVARELDALSNYAIAFTSFTLMSVMGMVFAGQWATRIGLARVALVAMGSLAFGSLVAGVANTLWMFAAGRAIQGFSIGIDLVTMYVIIGRAYPEKLRPQAFAILAGAWVVPGLAGPALAGYMVEQLSWRWVFLIVPITLIAPLMLLVPRIRALPDVEEVAPTDTLSKVLAAVVSIAGLSIFQFGLSLASHRGLISAVLVALSGLAITTYMMIWLMPTGFLRLSHGVPSVVAIRGILAGAYFAAEAYLPLALQSQRGLSVGVSGLVLAIPTVTWFLGSWFQGKKQTLISRHGILVLGCTLVLASLVALPLAVFMPSSALGVLVASCTVWALGAAGMGMAFPSLGVLLLELSPDHEHPKHSASIQMADSFGVITVTALAGGILSYSEAQHTTSNSTFVVIWVLCAVVALVAAISSPRVRALS